MASKEARELSKEIDRLDLEIADIQDQRQKHAGTDGDCQVLLASQRKLARKRLTLIVRRKVTRPVLCSMERQPTATQRCPGGLVRLPASGIV